VASSNWVQDEATQLETENKAGAESLILSPGRFVEQTIS
jgi:hypothetical protein